MEIKEDAKLLFMKYALPCAGTLVRRGHVNQRDIDMLIETVKNNGRIPKDAEKMFKVAFSACSLLAMEKKKSLIDSDIIREYFLLKHDDVIDMRYEEMGDFDPQACRIRIGNIEDIEDEFATVVSPDIRRKYRTDFVDDLKKNDSVITHWNFIVEKNNEKAKKTGEHRHE